MNAAASRWSYVRLWRELFALSWREHPVRVALLLALKLASAGTIAALALSLRAVVDAIVAEDPRAAMIAAAGAALSATVAGVAPGLESYLGTFLADSIGQRFVGQEIERAVVSLPGLEHLERSDFLDRLTMLDGAFWNLPHGLWNAIEVVFAALRLTVLLLLLGTVSPILLLLLAVAAVALWLDQRGRRGVVQAETETAEMYRLQRHLFKLATHGPGGKEIRVAGVGDELARRQRAAWDAAIHRRLVALVGSARWKLVGWVLITASFAGGLALVLDLAAAGDASVGDVVLAVTVAVTLRDSIQMALVRVSYVLNAGVHIEPFLWLRDYVARHRPIGASAPVPARLRDGITLEKVSFTYPGTDRPALDDVSCRLAAGSVVAIVGEFGSGKTSLVKLLTRFYPPNAGIVRVDGLDLSSLDIEAWRARCSAAFQDFGRFHLRFGEAVGLGDLPHAEDSERIGTAVAAADASGLVARLPQGLETQLGRVFDGVELSEGQWQKTALARASMRQEPLLFVLDEPTASLDAPSESAILERYMVRARELAARTGAITVIVSHRFSTVTGADQIIVLDAGRIVESGTHDELVARGGRYASLYGIQATAYSLT